jgi:hypothetical protein
VVVVPRVLVFDTDLYLYVWDTMATFLSSWEPGMWDEVVLVVGEGGERYRIIAGSASVEAVPEGAPLGKKALAHLVQHHLVSFMRQTPEPSAALSVLIDQAKAGER